MQVSPSLSLSTMRSRLILIILSLSFCLSLALLVAAAEEQEDGKPTPRDLQDSNEETHPRALSCVQAHSRVNYGATERT
ncbi:hypothetical protein C8T65DRAFT_654831 [Cerioporus squamosus]|nr:hypothetical protein C8T65DRAFT_654831 [Cerioporus squamosus]